MSKLSREKGKRWEQEVVRMLRLVPGFQDCCTRRAGGESAVKGRGRDILHTPGFCFQAKVGKNPNWRKALEEAKNGARGTKDISVALMRVSYPVRDERGRWSDSGPAVAVLSFGDFVELLSAMNGLAAELARKAG